MGFNVHCLTLLVLHMWYVEIRAPGAHLRKGAWRPATLQVLCGIMMHASNRACVHLMYVLSMCASKYCVSLVQWTKKKEFSFVQALGIRDPEVLGSTGRIGVPSSRT